MSSYNSAEALLERTGGNYPNGGKKEGVVMGLYTAHDRAIKRIPDYFYTAFAGELFSIYGWSRSKDMFYPDSAPEYVDLGSGTVGWVQAFRATCQKLEMEWLLKYYEDLPWYDSDVFDGIVEQEIGRRFMNRKDDVGNGYYRYLLGREQNRESTDEI